MYFSFLSAIASSSRSASSPRSAAASFAASLAALAAASRSSMLASPPPPLATDAARSAAASLMDASNALRPPGYSEHSRSPHTWSRVMPYGEAACALSGAPPASPYAIPTDKRGSTASANRLFLLEFIAARLVG